MAWGTAWDGCGPCRGWRSGAPAARSGLRAPSCGLGCPGSGKRVVDRRGLSELSGREGAGGWAVGWAGRSRGEGSRSCCCCWGWRVGMGWAAVPPIPSFLLPHIFALPPRCGFLCPTWVGLGTGTPDSILGSSSRLFCPLGLHSGSVISPGPRGVVFSLPGRGNACVDARDLFCKAFRPDAPMGCPGSIWTALGTCSGEVCGTSVSPIIFSYWKACSSYC